jgi:hypothetical protein
MIKEIGYTKTLVKKGLIVRVDTGNKAVAEVL